MFLPRRPAPALGDRRILLEEGDAAAIPAGRPYLWENPGRDSSRVVLVSTR